MWIVICHLSLVNNTQCPIFLYLGLRQRQRSVQVPNTSLREAALQQSSVTTPTATLSTSAQCPMPND
ncbi:MAG: hypothetical protein V7L00_21980 [Nostoc sp.]|uniref:hypothetical protein n=1 Tax=unclassified Nostoc TaxID=2593658 RepID=UPI0025EE51CE|nr:hypothetical protein [Nostoc sp. JL33]MBN3873522.1 hypothetical protein [Nostoc sp. JL33]